MYVHTICVCVCHVSLQLKFTAGALLVQVFDLKGSLRNRNVKTDSGKESCEVVLLDENLLKLIHDNPLYIRSHCKSILRAAIHSDAYFLSSHLIIDYSLLVGRDDATDQLVVGIIGKKIKICIKCVKKKLKKMYKN